MSSRYRTIKHLGDRLTAFILLVILLPVFAIIIVLYLVFGMTPVFFRQRRVGIDNRIFTLYKFRTLRNAGSTLQERTFWLGNFLRFTSLDELPQLVNILKGDMSFIGPRPLPEEYLPLFSDLQRKRHDVLPGITGLAQINGRHALAWNEKFAFDIYYVEHASFVLDFTILVRTIMLILSFKKDISLEEKPFTRDNNA